MWFALGVLTGAVIMFFVMLHRVRTAQENVAYDRLLGKIIARKAEQTSTGTRIDDSPVRERKDAAAVLMRQHSTTQITDEQRRIDISNLRFYAASANEWGWGTAAIAPCVVERTLNGIADRMEKA
jgi:hypothetical protein